MLIPNPKETDLCLDSRCYCVDVIAHILRMNQPSNLAILKSCKKFSTEEVNAESHRYSNILNPGTNLFLWVSQPNTGPAISLVIVQVWHYALIPPSAFKKLKDICNGDSFYHRLKTLSEHLYLIYNWQLINT